MLPMVVSMLIVSIYTIVDGFFISNFTGSTAFAAMNLVWPFISLEASVGLMIGAGGSALVSKTFGEGRPDYACRIFTVLVRFCLIVSIVLALVTIVFMRPIVVALGADEAMVPYATMYGRIVFAALPFFVLQMAFQYFFMTAERPELATTMSIVSGVTNIALDALFILGFHWGLTGAAIATAVSLAVSGIFPLVWFGSRRNKSHLRYRSTRPLWREIGQSCTNGLSEYVANIALAVVGICYNLQLMRLIGENGVSAYGILMYVSFIFSAVFIGYNNGMTQIAAYNYGAENRVELHSLLRKSFVLIALGGLAMMGIAEGSARIVARTFVRYDQELCALTVHALRIYCISFLLIGFNMFVSAWFTSLGNGLVSAAAAFFRTLVCELGAVFLLPLLLGPDGIWYSVCVAELAAFVFSLALLRHFRSRYGY